MKIANVIYVTQASSVPLEVELDAELARIGLDPSWNIPVAGAKGWQSPQSAALELMQRGAHRVDFCVARWEAEGGLTLLDSHMKRAS